jgi:hypothetical protein
MQSITSRLCKSKLRNAEMRHKNTNAKLKSPTAAWSSPNSCARLKKKKSRRPVQSFGKISELVTHQTSGEQQLTMVFPRVLFVAAFVVFILLGKPTNISNYSPSIKKKFLWTGSSTSMLQATQSVSGPSNRSVMHSVEGHRQRTGFTVFSSGIRALSLVGLLDLIQNGVSVSTKKPLQTTSNCSMRSWKSSASHGRTHITWMRKVVSVEEDEDIAESNTLCHVENRYTTSSKVTTLNLSPSSSACVLMAQISSQHLCFPARSIHHRGGQLILQSSKISRH